MVDKEKMKEENKSLKDEMQTLRTEISTVNEAWKADATENKKRARERRWEAHLHCRRRPWSF